MAIELKKPSDLPAAASVAGTVAIPIDNGTSVEKATPVQIVNAGRPIATEVQAVTGTDNTTAMTPLTTRQAIDGDTSGAVVKSKAWAESATAPGDPGTKSSKTWATEAATSAGTASTAAGSAATSAGTATTQAGIATTAAGNAATSEANAATSAGTAATQAGIATTAAGEATAARDEISDLTAAATTLAPGASATASYNAGTGVLSLGIPEGQPGTGDVDGPASAVADRIAVFDGTTGKLLKDGGKSVGSLADKPYTSKAAAQSATIPAGTDTIVLSGFYTAHDGGGGSYLRVASEPTHGGKLQSADGSWWELSTLSANPLMFGATRSPANSNAAFQSAFDYARIKNIPIDVSAGTWVISQSLPVFTYMSLRGEGGANKTVIRLADGSNTTMLYGLVTDTYFTSNPWADGEFEGDNFWDISDITFDGNMDNQTSGDGMKVWGRRWSLRNVVFRNIKEVGMTTKFSDGTTPLGMEARIDNVIIDRCGKDGWYFAGPHDSTINGMVVIDAGLTATNTYAALRVVSGGNGRFFGFHAWSRGWNTSRMAAALLQEAGGGACSFDNSHFEGAYGANVYLDGDPCQFGPTCMFYAAWNGKNIVLASNGHSIYGQLSGPGAGRPASIGIQLGVSGTEKSAGNLIVINSNNQAAGVIDFTYSDGSNMITALGYNASGVFKVGTAPAADRCEIFITGGGGGKLFQTPP